MLNAEATCLGGRFMNAGVCKGRESESWKDLYQAAIFEPDLNKLPERIAEAESALIVRARELFYTAEDHAEEGDSLDDAMCILRALRSSLKHRPTPIHRTSEFYYLKRA
jgi:hypothetical protein